MSSPTHAAERGNSVKFMHCHTMRCKRDFRDRFYLLCTDSSNKNSYSANITEIVGDIPVIYPRFIVRVCQVRTFFVVCVGTEKYLDIESPYSE